MIINLVNGATNIGVWKGLLNCSGVVTPSPNDYSSEIRAAIGIIRDIKSDVIFRGHVSGRILHFRLETPNCGPHSYPFILTIPSLFSKDNPWALLEVQFGIGLLLTTSKMVQRLKEDLIPTINYVEGSRGKLLRGFVEGGFFIEDKRRAYPLY